MKKRWKLSRGLGLIVPVVAYVAFVWIAAGWLVTPPRKPLQPYHREWIEHAQDHGFRLSSGATAAGVPYLLCEPDAAAGPSERGRTLRRQLSAHGVPVSPFGKVRGTLVILHGRGMRKEDCLLIAERFCAAGFRCLLPDLPAHGENPETRLHFGAAREERELPRQVLASASARFGFPSRPAALWGMSMGGAFAIEAAAERPRQWASLVVVSSFDELKPVIDLEARRMLGGFAPATDLGLACAFYCRGGYSLATMRPVEKAAKLSMPVMIVHGTNDPLIKLERGERLYQAVPHEHKSWLQVAGARHGDVLTTPQPVFCEMAAWLIRSITFPPESSRAKPGIPAVSGPV